MSDAREIILARIRATRRPTAAAVPRDYARTSPLTDEEIVALFRDRVADHGAEVRGVGDIAAAVDDIAAAHGATRLVVPSGLPRQWRPSHVQLVDDTNLTAAELDRVDGVLTGSTLAIAETGTIALTGSRAEGRRALTLIPDLHICVVAERDVVHLLPEGLAVLEGIMRQQNRALTLISGPSATSDIELARVEGVHGPRKLVVLIASQTAKRKQPISVEGDMLEE